MIWTRIVPGDNGSPPLDLGFKRCRRQDLKPLPPYSVRVLIVYRFSSYGCIYISSSPPSFVTTAVREPSLGAGPFGSRAGTQASHGSETRSLGWHLDLSTNMSSCKTRQFPDLNATSPRLCFSFCGSPAENSQIGKVSIDGEPGVR